MATDWYSRSKQDIRDGMVYLVKFPDGRKKYVEEDEYAEIKDQVELLDQLPKRYAPQMSDALDRFDRYMH